MNKYPLFSIVVPCYNVARYLHDCLDSVLAQVADNWECLCVNDGSTDETGAILGDYAKRDARIRVIHQKNAGEGAARNAALEIAQGDYICFLDGDDAYNKHAIQIMDEAVRMYGEVDVLCFGALHRSTDVRDGFIREDLGKIKMISGAIPRDSFSYKSFREAGGCMVYNRTTMGELRFCKKVIGADMVMSFSMYWRAKSWTYIDTAVYFYLQRETSAIHKVPSLQSVMDNLMLEWELNEMLMANKDKWRLNDMREFLAWNARFTYYSFQGMFFALSNANMKKCLPLWLKSQRGLWHLGAYPFVNKLKISLISLFPRPIVVRTVTRCVDGLYWRFLALKKAWKWQR